MTKAMVIAEHVDAARELCAGARSLADEVVLVAFCAAPDNCADRVAAVEVPSGCALDDAYATLIPFLEEEGPEVVLVEPTKRMKSVAGRLAAYMGTAVITDVAALEDGVARGMYYGGVGQRDQRPTTSCAMYTIQPGVFAECVPSGENQVVVLDWVAPAAALKVLSTTPIEKKGVDLTKADVVVAVGRGFGSAEELQVAEDLAASLGGGVGCTRPLAEGADLMPAETYIGVSGLVVAPKVYVAAGLSGQMQHMVGCAKSGLVVAVNKDKNAPVFKQCDYGLIGDVATVLPALTAALS
ncbi:electron transfer flavoprotein subunit alpha/FixB family protein [Adlercreutzia sp. ZJ141]|uniref:electron transfer flavoprotein subunit alpha/FixB family protein n=1 Tax=Adlercreutzia sp. ZJ141 TaxID=2709406 RepID=UPI0013EABCA5|nr:electron transfer flavoprotein subunit alpha/FixB family protein [Adlercreutzia sp. ZJ141]